jgi:hypothetical protein
MSHMHLPHPRSSSRATRDGRRVLSPPWLRELPREVFGNERELRVLGVSLPKRALIHDAWIVFRVAYCLGWNRAMHELGAMPHRTLPEAQI